MTSYEQFIEEIESLLSIARDEIISSPRRSDDDNFKRWRHKVEMLIDRIQNEGYQVICDLINRSFYPAVLYIAGENDYKASFVDAMKDTINELDYIVEEYHKYGEPPKYNPKMDMCGKGVRCCIMAYPIFLFETP